MHATTQPRSGSSGPACATACGDSSTVEPEHATLEIRVRFSVTAPSTFAGAPCRAQPSLRSSEEGASHTRGPGGSTLPAATDPEWSNSRIRGLEPLGWGCNSLLRSRGFPRLHVEPPGRSADFRPERPFMRGPSSGDDTCLTSRRRRVRSSRPVQSCLAFSRGTTSRGYRFNPGVSGCNSRLAPRPPAAGSNAPEPRLWKSNREWSRARPLPGAYRKVWCSSRLTSARNARPDEKGPAKSGPKSGPEPGAKCRFWVGGGYRMAAPVCKTGSLMTMGVRIPPDPLLVAREILGPVSPVELRCWV